MDVDNLTAELNSTGITLKRADEIFNLAEEDSDLESLARDKIDELLAAELRSDGITIARAKEIFFLPNVEGDLEELARVTLRNLRIKALLSGDITEAEVREIRTCVCGDRELISMADDKIRELSQVPV